MPIRSVYEVKTADRTLKPHLTTRQSTNPKNILDLLYEAYNDTTGMHNEEIEADFEKLCRLMNGRSLKEIDEVIYAVCSLCRDHEEERFVEGVRVEMGLSKEVNIS